MRQIKIKQIHKMLQEIVTDYRVKGKKVIKWYEYRMSNPVPDATETIPEDVPSTAEVQDMMEDMAEVEEEIDLASTGLNEDEQALVADILERFKEAKQVNIESIVASATAEMAEPAEERELSEEELIAAICAPKQHMVDDMVNQANS